ncbi:MAG: hypothetical protein NMNS01_21320 [Nitrosomonas sp.]|nr:MAG: hypothetical protein NMNS01_21320 [Nitrosomonas sp.]
MAGNDKKGIQTDRNRKVHSRTTSFAGKTPELAGDTPATFHQVPSQRQAFDHARDPYVSMQLKDMEKTEAQRRGESERSAHGSEMVKQSKPFPELRPANENAPIRESFNRAWLREQRAARLAELERQREVQHAIEQAERAMQQDFEMKPQEQRMPER